MLCDPNPTDHCIVVSSGMYPWTPTHRIPFGGDCKKIFTDDANLISELSITYDGNLVITAALDGKVEVFEAMTGSPVAELRTQKSQNYFVNNLRNNTQYLIVFLHDEGLTQNTFFITNDQLFLGGR
jgi:WD40 repeat protein